MGHRTACRGNVLFKDNAVKLLQGKHIVVFVIGGLTRSEIRTAHKLSVKLGREVLLGSTSMETPTSFLNKLSELGSPTPDMTALEISHT